MKTSSEQIKHIDDFLSGQLSTEDHLLAEAKLLLQPQFKWNVFLQKKVRALAIVFGRKKIRAEAEAIGRQMLTSPQEATFQKNIQQLFNQH